MSSNIEKAKNILQGSKLRVAGKIVDDGKDAVKVKMAGYLLEIPRESLIEEEKAGDGMAILHIKRDAEVMMTSITSIDALVGSLSKRITKGDINADTECCDCTECSYCSDCTECSYCTDRGWPMRMRVLPQLTQIRRGRI